MKKLLAILLLAVVVLGTWASALRNGLVWDDTALVMRDPFIRSWRLIPEGFQHFLFTDATASDFYRPIQRLSYTFDYAVFGFWTAGYHLTSVLCHLAAAVALFLFAGELLRRFEAGETVRRWVPLAAALVWAVHPVHSAAVAYISGRADPLAAAFGFTGLWLGLWSWRSAGARMWVLTVLAGAALLLSGLSKEAGLIFLPAWLVLLTFRGERAQWLRALVVVAFVAVIYLSLRLPAHHNPAPQLRTPAPLLVRPILIARAFAEYTGLVFLPVHLRMERDVETHPSGSGPESLTHSAWRELQTLAGILLLAGFIYWLLRERKQDRAVFACLLLTLLTYVPISGIVPLNATVAEHWLYLPTAFFFLALALTAVRLLRYPQLVRVAAIGVAVCWVAFLSGRSFVRAQDWRDQRTFFERTLAQGGDTPRTRINLASVEVTAGRLDEAQKHLELALQKEPNQPFAVLNLGTLALKQNNFERARELLLRAKDMPVVEAQAHEALAVLTSKEKGTVDLTRLRLASRSGIPNWSIEKRYVSVLHEVGSTDRALAELQRVLTTAWYRADSWLLLSQLLTASGRPAEAAAALARARDYDVRLDERAARRAM